jgi:hypothetical protein
MKLFLLLITLTVVKICAKADGFQVPDINPFDDGKTFGGLSLKPSLRVRLA